MVHGKERRQRAMSSESKTVQATAMYREAGEAPLRVASQLDETAERVAAIAAALRKTPPRAVLTCARGSSDHAATYARYLIDTSLGLLTSSASPSVSSVYGVRQDLDGCLFLVISQSGKSPDLLTAAAAAKASGAIVLALVNAEDSPLASMAHHVVPLTAGQEHSVAATKSYICALAAALHLVARWSGDPVLAQAIATLPGELASAWTLDWQAMVDLLTPAQNLFVLGRGLGLAVAQEAALKFKETCGLHAEAFSSAEVRHGPMALLRQGLPVLMFAQDDETRAGSEALAAELAAGGIKLLLSGAQAAGTMILPSQPAPAVIQPLLQAQSFYRAAVRLSVARGFDPDHPPHLKKVTETL
jgi:glucosamine--fructose-6-phosphate aminotransferase (isomerizing)